MRSKRVYLGRRLAREQEEALPDVAHVWHVCDMCLYDALCLEYGVFPGDARLLDGGGPAEAGLWLCDDCLRRLLGPDLAKLLLPS